MNRRSAIRRLTGCRHGTTTVEFAMISAVLFPMCFGIIEAGMLLWTQGALQSTAALVARCAAISSPLCTNPQTYAVNTAASWIMSGIIATSDVTVSTSTTCPTGSGASGNFKKVTITSEYWGTGFLPAPWGSKNLTVTACYPT